MHEWRRICNANEFIDPNLQHTKTLDIVEATATPEVYVHFVPREKLDPSAASWLAQSS